MNRKLIAGLALTLTSLTLAQAMDTVNGDAMMKQEKAVSSMTVDGMKSDQMVQDKMADTSMMKSESAPMYDEITPTSGKMEISKLQMMLVEKGYLSMPKDVSYGYYGMRTKMAFKKYRTASKMMMKDTKSSTTMMKATGTMMQ